MAMPDGEILYNGIVLVAASPWLACLCRSDWKTRRLPNRLTLGGLVVALVFRLGFGGVAFLDGLGGMLVCGAFLLLPVLLRAAGSGDLKMIAACGAVAGFSDCLNFLLAMSLCGLALVIVMLATRAADGARLKHYARSLFDWRYDRAAGRAALPPKEAESVRVPFGIAIAAGLWLVLLLRCAKGWL